MRLQSTRFTGATVFAIIATIAPQIGCSSKSSTEAPYITVFYPMKSTIVVSTSTTIVGMFKNGVGVITDADGNVVVDNVISLKEYTITPLVTTTYTLTVTNSAGVKSTWDTTVTVVPAPVIASFDPAKGSVNSGDSTTLTAVFDDGCTGEVTTVETTPVDLGAITSGEPFTVTPDHSTTYLLTITNTANGGTATKTCSVNVVSKGPGDYTTDMSSYATVIAPNASSWTYPATIASASVTPSTSELSDDAISSAKIGYGAWPYAQEDNVEYSFSAEITLKYSQVYWLCDSTTGTIANNEGGIGAPSSYKIQYLDSDGATWVDVTNPFTGVLSGTPAAWSVDSATAAYTVAYDAYNTVGFDSVDTQGIRLLTEPRAQASDYARALGIYRWKVYGGWK